MVVLSNKKLMKYKLKKVFKRNLSNVEFKDSISVAECIKIYRLKIKKLEEQFEKIYGDLLEEDKEIREFKREYDVEGLIKYINDEIFDGKRVVTNRDIDILAKISSQRKLTSIDEYLPQISRVLNQFKVIRRSYDKPMMTPKSHVLIKSIKKLASESHLTMRGMHQDQVADLSAEIAYYQGLNVELARTMGKHHDDGHSNGGHTGQTIASYIGMLNNCGYMVHNALSPDMLIQENAISKILELVERKEGKLSPERKEEVKRDFWYILDGPISHNGEGNERIIRYNPNKTPEEIIEDKNKCYTIKGYDKTIIPGSKEAALVAFVDRICYVRSDILDGVSLGILTEFNDDYLKYIGILAAKHNGEDKLFKMYTKIFEDEEKIDNKMNEYVYLLESNGIKLNDLISKDDLKNNLPENINIDFNELAETIKQYKKIKKISNDALETATEYGRQYVAKIPIEKRSVTVADMIKDSVVDDLKEYCNGKDFIGISPAVAKAFFGIRKENLRQIVQFTKRRYEIELLPNAELKIFNDLKNALINTGIIDEFLLSKADNEEYLVTKFQMKMRHMFGISSHINIKGIKDEEKDYITTKDKLTRLKEYSKYRRQFKYERKICHHFLKLNSNIPGRVEEIYNNAITAVDDITKNDVLAALDIKPIVTDILNEEYEKKINKIRAEIEIRYPKGMSEEEIKDYIKELSNRRKNNKSELLASAIALEYVAGMSDSTLIEASRLKKYLRYRQIVKGYSRGAKPEDEVYKMDKMWSGPEDKKNNLANLFPDERE